jgi:nicotinamide-nucleotide amidase
MLMIAEVIAVGTELTSGQKLDTNSQWLARRLGEMGIEVRYHTTLDDHLARNVEALRVAASRVQLAVISGGLGPTQDDLTREALATLAEVPLEEDEASLRAIQDLFARRDRPMLPRNRVQALLPSGAQALPNAIGTAPGVWMRIGNTVFVALPGVPNELKAMFDAELAPRLRALLGPARVYVHRVINLFGKGESEVEADAFDLTTRGRDPEVGITASDATISLRVRASGSSEAEALRAMEPTVRLIYERFGQWIVGEGDVDVPQALAKILLDTKTTLATAESCTGGLIATRLTDISGVSDVFLGGVVSYSNEAKTRFLDVPAELIATHGAVSAEVARAMAEGARRRFGADLGLSVTGIAGPCGGSAEKPVGLVYLGLASAAGTLDKKLLLGPEQPRSVIRSRAAKHAMNWLRLEVAARAPGR